MVGRLLANRTASPFSGAAGMPRNQGLASVGITGCFASESECPAGIRRNTHAGDHDSPRQAVDIGAGDETADEDRLELFGRGAPRVSRETP